MFSELCRETLRKAAVCYSARAGSPSPSPPTSPPPSPAKEAKTAANADLANVRDAIHEGVRDHQHHHHHSGTTTAGKRTSPTGNTTSESGQRDPASERSASDRPTDRPNDFREYVYVRKRPAMPTDFSKRLPGLEAREGRRSGTCGTTEFRESRSVSPEKGTGRQHEDHRGGGGSAGNECGRSDTRISRRSSGSSPEPEDNSSTSGDEAGAAPEETNQRSSSAHNRHSLTKEQTMHWFAQIGGDDSLSLTDVKRPRSLYDEDSLDGDRPYDNEGRESTGSSKELDRAKLVRERQNEERQRKLEELRQQALAAQRFREQREEERRRRIDELRSRDNDRRNQVEERKRLICEAERERREAILRKNQEREARIEAKKRNERSHIVFAFGSSTPRMLEPADTGGSTFWGTRRATSTTNVMMFSAAQPLTRRSSERELDGSKKRATSAGGLDRKPGEDLVDTKLTKDSKPPLPKVHSTPKKPSIPKVAEVRKPTEKLIKNAKSSPRITPKATPLQSPGAEHAPLIRETNVEIIKQDENKETQNVKSEDKNEEKKDQGSEKTQEANIVESITNDTKIGTEPVSASKQVKDETNLMQENLSGAIAEEPSKIAKKEENKQEKKSPEMTEIKLEAEMDEQVDMSASMIAKIRITTEEEAKAALAERRRLAREQAEREAELERQRQEEEARIEAERLRAEEEEQRRLEEETIRLANEAREAEEQRLQLAIEEAKRREEEDRRKREEEARQKQEKEEAERKAREEAEKQRIEMAERLKKEEEERNARRKRVEAIMLRTRGKNQTNTSTKGEGGDGDKLKEDSPTDENKPMPDGKGDDVMTASLISEATQQFISGEQRAHHTENSVPAPDIVHNGTTHSNGINENKIVLDNNQGNVEGELNGHHTNHGNSINSQSITLDNATVKQNNVTNNLLDLSDFDTLSNNSTGYDTGPILELTPNLANEDTLNSNLNPAAMPFTPMGFVPAATNANVNPFQDNFINKPQDNNQVPDLLS
ncbi:PREDICTED: ensconsin isoform X17 [Acromyrmex echinatior]|uniref:ensconsin isoform X17 n=1 Tax=Acromyrmex echinatior TaxID=103372 RepID=UPI000580DB31|nr:PREDICTED: ensconsin isoform X17 [Acromyrmex echinatior]